MNDAVTVAEWANRAEAAETSVRKRNLRRLWAIPGTALGVVGAPAKPRERVFVAWNYWWQAHLIDVTVDAEIRAPSEERRQRITNLSRGVHGRNFLRWTNRYYDDMAWLALALERAQRLVGLDLAGPVAELTAPLYDAWAPVRGGGIPWRIASDYFNAAANGPAGIALARTAREDRAIEMADWLDATLRDPDSALIFDGVHLPSGGMERVIYTYCQGVALGLETELAQRTSDPVHAQRVHRLVDAVATNLAPNGVIVGGTGGDGGLFDGILARYLALVTLQLPGDEAADVRARQTAGSLVISSARAAWRNRTDVESLPIFGPDWSVPARAPATGLPERELSVQLSGWMLLEAAHRVAAT